MFCDTLPPVSHVLYEVNTTVGRHIVSRNALYKSTFYLLLLTYWAIISTVVFDWKDCLYSATC